jgi:nucleoside phosphorylase/7-cyano-7-deazaguanine synthase in queuosine biosynthesis
MSALRNIVACNGADCSFIPPSEDPYRLLVLDYRNLPDRPANVRLGLPSFVSDVFHLPDRLLDLLEIAAYVYCADRLVKRGETDSLEFHSWSRSMHFLIRVRDQAFWSQYAVRGKLNELLSFLSGNQAMEFTFQRGHSTPPSNLFDQPGFDVPVEGPASVALFSGGIDSLAGALTRLTESRDHVYLVSHRSGQPSVRLTQTALAASLVHKYPGRVSHYVFESGLTGKRAAEETQRTRFFLYASIAYALAHRLGLQAIHVFENGVTSINLPRRQDLMLARASRTTHPKTITLMQEFFSLLEQAPVEVKTPFFEKTKSDVLAVLRQVNGLDLLSSAVSCSKTFKAGRGGTHCGGCSQCVDRRFAAFAVGADDFDDAGLYSFDFLTQAVTDPEIRTTLLEYVRQARDLASTGLDAFYVDEAASLVDVVGYLPGLDEARTVECLWLLHKRHGDQVILALNSMRKLLGRMGITVPEGSLLPLARTLGLSSEQDQLRQDNGQSRPDTTQAAREVPTPQQGHGGRKHGVAVVLTAQGLECDAVLAHLTNRKERLHPDGTVYEVGRLDMPTGWWEVVVAEIGEGNETAGAETERAVAFFRPRVILFVGVADGIHGVRPGDVVAATEVLNYESGQDMIDFNAQARSRSGAYGLLQRARSERRAKRWLTRIGNGGSSDEPEVHIGPIAAGWKVVSSNRAKTYSLLKQRYSHCLAVEMEGYGFLDAASRLKTTEALVVRGITRLINGRGSVNTKPAQMVAARNAAAFAFEVLAQLGGGQGKPDELTSSQGAKKQG